MHLAVGGECRVDLFEGHVGGIFVGRLGTETPEEAEGIECCAAGGGVFDETFGGTDCGDSLA